MRQVLAGVLATTALLATACGSSESGSVVSDAPASFEDLDFESPIADFLGVDQSFDSGMILRPR